MPTQVILHAMCWGRLGGARQSFFPDASPEERLTFLYRASRCATRKGRLS